MAASSSFAGEAGHAITEASAATTAVTAPKAATLSSRSSAISRTSSGASVKASANNANNANNSTPAAQAQQRPQGPQAQQQGKPLSSPPSSPSHTKDANILHTHRQNHNSSKLPAFRFADLKKESLALPSLLQHIPPSPVSPDPAQIAPDSAGTTASKDDRRQQHQPQPQPQSQSQSQSQSQPQPSSLQDVQQPGHQAQQSQESGSGSGSGNGSGSGSGGSRTGGSGRGSGSGPSNPATTTSHDNHNSRIQNQNPALLSSTPTPAVSSSSSSSRTSPVRSRASTQPQAAAAQPAQPSTATTSSKRPASFPDSPQAAPAPPTRPQRTLTDPSYTSGVTKSQQQRRAPASFSSHGLETSNGPPTSLSSRRLTSVQIVQGDQGQGAPDGNTKDWAQGQRELILPRAVQDKPSADDKRKSTSRPPVSFRPPRNDGTSPRAVIPPIRSFRSSGSRKSLVLDMSVRSLHSSEDGDSSDPNHHDRTLRALEGRTEEDYLQMTPPDSAGPTPDGENTADIFMRIAREDSTRRGGAEDDRAAEEQSTVSRVGRTTRRPFSAAIPSHRASSPPQVTRRLSDQRENSRSRRLADDQSVQYKTRELTYRSLSKDKSIPMSQKSEISRTRTIGSARPSPSTPQTAALQDAPVEVASVLGKRRSSSTEGSSILPARTSSYKAIYSLPRNYNSSPLVPRNGEPQQRQETHELVTHGVEGTESTSSTAAPSTLWDELDELKSRMRRLELTGKIPPTSGAAMSRVSDDRPPTATTNATTMSGSPKRASGNAQAPAAEVSSTTSSQKEAQPILRSALSKAKPYLSVDVYSAIDAAATDALALSQMVGVVGQPGPISSGASTIGTGLTATVTDRQLRRKAESICRNLTELCLALSDEASQSKAAQQPLPSREDPVTLMSPTAVNSLSSLATNRRTTTMAESTLSKITTSPRAYTRMDDRRTTMINPPTLPAPRFTGASNNTSENVGRKSSLLVTRTRRAGTEEPEEMSGRKSSLLRTRRAQTEEPEEGRKSSLLIRGRKGALTSDDEEDEPPPPPRFRAPSRAVTEVAALRVPPVREFHGQLSPPDSTPLASSALPRRRLVPSSLNSRLVAPSSTGMQAARRFLDRSTPDRETNSVAEKLAEDRGQRQISFSQSTVLNRNGSQGRRRESAIPSLSSTASQVGGYR